MRGAVLVALLLGMGCKSGTRTTDTRSSSITSKELKLAFLKDYMGSPTAVEDVEFHIVVHDNSGGMLSGPSDSDLRAAVRVKPDHVAKWAESCEAARLEVRPSWVDPMLKGKTGWEVKSQPDTYRCGREERVIHVREGVIFRRIATEG
jgi:hypothetical protein